MEEFARGFPNQHTTHRDTRYICMQTFVSARGPTATRATGKTCRGMARATSRSRASASVVRAQRVPIHIYTRVECKVHARVHIANACARGGVDVCMRARTMTQKVDKSTRRDQKRPKSNRASTFQTDPPLSETFGTTGFKL